MNKIILPPSFDENILDFYKADFDCVYIIFHPFIIFTKDYDLDKLFIDQTNIITRSIKINKNGQLFSWKDFMELSGLKTY